MRGIPPRGVPGEGRPLPWSATFTGEFGIGAPDIYRPNRMGFGGGVSRPCVCEERRNWCQWGYRRHQRGAISERFCDGDSGTFHGVTDEQDRRLSEDGHPIVEQRLGPLQPPLVDAPSTPRRP